MPATGSGRLNHLAQEKSPYLRRHAGNPVDWYPWGEEAFSRSRRENKPVFLSIGYSTCHWCHVMEQESFTDQTVAEILNKNFIAIKLDREERPDIDRLYIEVSQILTGRAGWPLTLFLTPEKQPFFAATYIPRESRGGHMGMLELLPRISDLWRDRKNDVMVSAHEIMESLKKTESPPQSEEPGRDLLETGFQQLSAGFDRERGGFGNAPKFPIAHNFSFLLRYWKRTGNPQALFMTEKTLQEMRFGGIFDHIGFGFHRYSTGRDWTLPHFEKMLYDQALLSRSYLEAFQATAKPIYRQTADEILSYVLTGLTSKEGGFYTAEDADSEGEEGRFYSWPLAEISDLLGKEDSLRLKIMFNLEARGNLIDEAAGIRSGRNILHRGDMSASLPVDLIFKNTEQEEYWEQIRRRLYARRETRVKPLRDEKILTDWNGLMIASAAMGGRICRKPEYTHAAEAAARFILTRMRREGRLFHRYAGGETAVPAFADDYIFFIHGLLELYRSTFSVEWLETAVELNRTLQEIFSDPILGGLYFVSPEELDIPVRKMEIYDGSIPSGNSIALMNLILMSGLLGNHEFENLAHQNAARFAGRVRLQPAAYTQYLSALDRLIGPSREIVICGEPQSNETQALLSCLDGRFLPSTSVLLIPEGESGDRIRKLAPFTQNMHSLMGKATAYVCHGKTCTRPLTRPEELDHLLS